MKKTKILLFSLGVIVLISLLMSVILMRNDNHKNFSFRNLENNKYQNNSMPISFEYPGGFNCAEQKQGTYWIIILNSAKEEGDATGKDFTVRFADIEQSDLGGYWSKDLLDRMYELEINEELEVRKTGDYSQTVKRVDIPEINSNWKVFEQDKVWEGSPLIHYVYRNSDRYYLLSAALDNKIQDSINSVLSSFNFNSPIPEQLEPGCSY